MYVRRSNIGITGFQSNFFVVQRAFYFQTKFVQLCGGGQYDNTLQLRGKDRTGISIERYLFRIYSRQSREHSRATLLDSQTSDLEEGLELTDSTHVGWLCRYWWTTELLGTTQDESRKDRRNLSETATAKINLLVHFLSSTEGPRLTNILGLGKNRVT